MMPDCIHKPPPGGCIHCARDEAAQLRRELEDLGNSFDETLAREARIIADRDSVLAQLEEARAELAIKSADRAEDIRLWRIDREALEEARGLLSRAHKAVLCVNGSLNSCHCTRGVEPGLRDFLSRTAPPEGK